MSNIAEIIDVSLTETQGAQNLAAFDTPAIMTDDTPNSSFGASNRAKEYTADSDGVDTVSTDFGTSSDAKAAAQIGVSQDERPATFFMLKRGTAVATEITLTFSTPPTSGDVISGSVNGTAVEVTFSSDAATTYGLLETAIEAIEGVASVTVASNVLTIVATAEWVLTVGDFTAEGGADPTIAKATSVAGRTIQDDISDALAEESTNTWYILCLESTNKGAILAAAAYIETTEKFLFVQSSESGIKTTGSTTDVAYRLNALNYRRTVGFYRETTTDYVNVGAAFKFLATAPGSIQLCNISLTGVVADTLTTTEVSEVETRNFNTFRKFGTASIVRPGIRVKGGLAAETTRDMDYWRNELREAGLSYITNSKKPPLSSQGLADLKATLQNVNNRMVTETVLSSDYTNEVDVPEFSELTSSDLTNRQVTGIKAYGTLLRGMIKAAIGIEAGV